MRLFIPVYIVCITVFLAIMLYINPELVSAIAGAMILIIAAGTACSAVRFISESRYNVS